MRSRAHRYWDKFIVLALFSAVSKISTVSGNIKAQKLTFLLELRALRAELALGHYRFFRYQMGPYSADLAEDIKLLQREQFIRPNRSLTKRGEFLRDFITESLADNDHLRLTNDIVHAVVVDYGEKSGVDLMEMVYGMKVPVFGYGREMKVRDIPTFVDILDPAHTPELRAVQPLPKDLIDDLDAEFAIDPARLEPGHPSYKQTVRRVLDRIST